MWPQAANEFIDSAEVPVGPCLKKLGGNFWKGGKRLTTSMQIQPVLVTTFRQIYVCSDPVLSRFNQRKPACSFCFDQSFALAFFTFTSSFSNEQSSIGERPNEVGQILMCFSLKHVVDPVRSAQISYQMVGSRTCKTCISTLV